ncbi:glycogen debranching N-terminal domain-containing protein [Nocardioides sp.]|uniref:amylo-alpha-1,6-glucosidase n=1 Tax=Nocardioides sp. TaxID=35761 RepID=UPI002D8056B8|nr:glycogen debranching N-terminal domain-containing protein [Nocardioides sp.]HET8961327.1 glycogen debranching N-terminal domain-containing protein [Nocardioides sp.]
MSGAWTPESEPTSTDGSVTLVEGSSFCLCSPTGDLGSEPFGVYFQDTRILSRWNLTVDGRQPQPLGALVPDPYRGTFLGRLRRSGRTDTNLLVERERRIGDGLREDLTIHNPGAEPTSCTVVLAVEADLADLFEVKAGRLRRAGGTSARTDGQQLRLEQGSGADRRGIAVEANGEAVLAASRPDQPATVRYDVVIPAGGRWSASLVARPVVEGREVEPSFPLGRPVAESLPAVRLRSWRESTTVTTTGHAGLQQVLRRSQEDLGALRIFEDEDPTLAAVAAGAPWFMALFGRDSLLSAYMALPLDPSLALGTLRTLARHQGRRSDPRSEEEPGRIVHELRHGLEAGQAVGGDGAYYGTADATPLFVVVLAELARWGADPEQVRELLPHADRALEWIERYGDRDGDGFVEYQRSAEHGLRNQGWKDSWDGVTFADGRPADTPIALCEVQGYVYQAYRARAELARDLGDDGDAERWTGRAAELRTRFNQRFWLPEHGRYALALDGDKVPVDSCASNMGHCLWSGIVDEDKAPSVVAQLLSPEMFSGWGIRTLGTTMGAYDPVSYHNGSVWPHDNALIVAGLMRYGFVDEARRVASAVLEAAERFGGRLPELFCGFDRETYAEPVPYPTSCSPQAWAAAAPVQLVRTLLRLDPLLPRARVSVAPVVPASYLPLRLDGLTLGGHRVDLEVTAAGASVSGLPASVELRSTPPG